MSQLTSVYLFTTLSTHYPISQLQAKVKSKYFCRSCCTELKPGPTTNGAPSSSMNTSSRQPTTSLAGWGGEGAALSIHQGSWHGKCDHPQGRIIEGRRVLSTRYPAGVSTQSGSRLCAMCSVYQRSRDGCPASARKDVRL